MEKKFIYKVVVFGDSNVGKTTFSKRFSSNKYNEHHKKTIGVDFVTKNIYINNQAEGVTIQIWDFSGEERFEVVFPMYLNGADGGLYLYDINNRESLDRMEKWFQIIFDSHPSVYAKENEELVKEEIKVYGHRQKHINIPIIIVGSKYDVYEDAGLERKVHIGKTIEVAENISIKKKMDHYSCSSKTGRNVKEVFNNLALKIRTKKQNEKKQEFKNNLNTI